MAGTNASFDGAGFRTAIKATMEMGMPADTTKQLTWHFNNVVSYVHQDPSSQPYNWKATPQTSTPSDSDVPSGHIVVDYALEFSGGSITQTEVGAFDTAHLVVTLLDEDFDQIKTADYATIGPVFYNIDFTGPPMGLFDVTVHQVFLTARDQS